MSKESAVQLGSLINQVVSNVNPLKILKAPIEHWDFILVPLITDCLDEISRKEWESSTGDSSDPSSFVVLIKFLNNRLRTLQAVEKF